MNDYSPLAALGIEMSQVRRYEAAQEEGRAYFFIDLILSQKTCPACGEPGAKIKEYKTKTMRGPRSQGLANVIECRVPRYICQSCGKTYTHRIGFAEDSVTKGQVDSIVAEPRILREDMATLPRIHRELIFESGWKEAVQRPGRRSQLKGKDPGKALLRLSE